MLVQFLVLKQARVLILSNRDLKRLKLLEQHFPDYIGSSNSDTTSDTSLNEESVYSVRHSVSDTVRPDPNTARPVTDKKVNNYSNVSTDTQKVGDDDTPPNGPRIQQTFSEPIEIQIDEACPEDAD